MTYTPPPMPPRKPRTGLIIGMAVAAVMLLVCCSCGAFVLLRPDAAAHLLRSLLGS